jgi:hypothetical protein
MKANEIRHLLREVAPIIDGTRRHLISTQDPVRDGDTVIVFTKCWSLMYDTRTIGICHVRIHNNSKRLIFKLFLK